MNEYVVDRYETTIGGNLRRDQREEPACTSTKAVSHCWHWESGNALSHPRAERREVCCWCGTVKVTKPNPDAHGPHHPNRRDFQMRYGSA